MDRKNTIPYNRALLNITVSIHNHIKNHKEMWLMTIISLLATLIMFNDYLPYFKKVHIWSDTEGFHWPLFNYAFTSLKEGRFPLWDPSIYCGIPFAGNMQSGLFYPPNWLMFASQWHRANLPYIAVEILAILHVWIAFVFSYCWLRLKTTHWLPTAMGAAVVAYSGYMLSQIVHLGVICGYAWIPFALWGIAEANEAKKWRPLWKVAIALAMCLLAGYPATFIAFVVIIFAYAMALPRRLSLIPQIAVALLVALLLSAVQLLPTMESTAFKVTEFRYGGKLLDHPQFYLTFLFPNFYDQNRTQSGPEVAQGDSMYLGAAALLGMLLFFRYPLSPWARQAIVVAAAVLIFLENPWGLVAAAAQQVPRIPDAMRSYNFLAGLAFPAALLSAGSVDAFLRKRTSNPKRIWATAAWVVIACCWCAALLIIARKGGMDFSSGLQSGYYALVSLALLAFGLFLYRSRKPILIASILLALLFCEYRVFGVNRKFNAVTGDVDEYYATDFRLGGKSLGGLDDQVFQELQKHPDRRIAVFQVPHTTDFRHYRLATPQGFDPFVSVPFKSAVERFHPFQTDRLFDMDVHNLEMMRTFGTGYVLVRKDTDEAKGLQEDANFRLLEPSDSFYQVYELKAPISAWQFESGETRVNEWQPESRKFEVTSTSGGAFVLIEQNLPGWTVAVDGQRQQRQQWNEVFQAVNVPAGKHQITFRYMPRGLITGSAITLVTVCVGLYLLLRKRHRPQNDDTSTSTS